MRKTTLVEDGYGILPDVAEYWKHNAALLKFGIMRGVGDAEIAYKEDLSWVSHNMQLPETGFHGTEEDQIRQWHVCATQPCPWRILGGIQCLMKYVFGFFPK
ncbi:MAG: hypothetical protein ACTHJ4_06340 [Candidatus Nucleicultricaceae bacterium]